MTHIEDANAKTRPFRLDEPEFNMGSYLGRVRHFFKLFNPV